MALSLKARARAVLNATIPMGWETAESPTIDLLPNGAAVVLLALPGPDDPLALLRGNASARLGVFPFPAVIDSQTGRFARRCVIPYRTWAGPRERLLGLLRVASAARGVAEARENELRLLLGVREKNESGEYRYGRSGRLSLRTDSSSVLLAAQVFPRGIVDAAADPVLEPDGAWLLLARSGADPHSFHMVRRSGLAGVERVAPILEEIDRGRFDALETALLRAAEEDRVILHTMFRAGLTGEAYGQAREANQSEENVR